MMSHQNQNLKNKFSSNLHKNKLNQSVNEVFMYNPLGYHNMYPVSNNLNKSVIMDNEIQELDEQEDDNNVIYKLKFDVYCKNIIERNFKYFQISFHKL